MGGFEISEKTNFIISNRSKIPTFSSVGPFFKEGGGGLENFGKKLKFLGFLDLAVAKSLQSTRTVTDAADDADDVLTTTGYTC